MLLYKGGCAACVAYIGWRLTASAVRRFAAVTTRNRRRKQELLTIWEGIAVRACMHHPACRHPQPTHDQLPDSAARARAL
jgi:hypothetical protein